MNANEQTVAAVLGKHQDALNASDTNAVMPLYLDDGVFMPPYRPSAVGREALKKAYDDIFKTITLHVKFNIAEVVEVGPEWVFARTNSAGTNLDYDTREKARKPIRNCSSSKKIPMDNGRLRAIVFPPPIPCNANRKAFPSWLQ